MHEKFKDEESELVRDMFNNGKSTLEVKLYLNEKYGCSSGASSNFIKAIRKSLGIYNGKASS